MLGTSGMGLALALAGLLDEEKGKGRLGILRSPTQRPPSRPTDDDSQVSMGCHSPYGLQAGVFTQDISRAMQAFSQLEVGGVIINNVPTWRVENMPYGGVKASGVGREGVKYAMEEMTELKLLVMNTA